MNKIIISALIGILFLCSGCVYIPYHEHIHRVPDDKMLASIKEGITNKADILMMLGEPDRVMEKECLFQYWWQIEHGIFGVYGGGGEPVRSTYSLHVYFDANNIVNKYELKKKGIYASLGGGAFIPKEILADKFLFELYAGRYIDMGVPYGSEIELETNGKGVWRVSGDETSFKWSIGDNEIRLETESEVIYGQIHDDILEILAPDLQGRYFKKAK